MLKFVVIINSKSSRKSWKFLILIFGRHDVGYEGDGAAGVFLDEGVFQELPGARPLVHADRQAAVEERPQVRTQILSLQYVHNCDYTST